MFSTLTEKVLAAVLCAAMFAGLLLTLYAGYEHMKVQWEQIIELKADVIQEKANTAAALQAASAVSAALDMKATVTATASKNHAASTNQLASAVAANPSVASAVVPETVWTAIYGSNPDAK